MKKVIVIQRGKKKLEKAKKLELHCTSDVFIVHGSPAMRVSSDFLCQSTE